MAEKYYRVTFDSKGIYSELKNVVEYKWKELKTKPSINWLPVPTIKYGKHTSYFTEKGYAEFQKKTLPLMRKYLDSNKIKIEEIEKPKGKIVYRDLYQVVTESMINSHDEMSAMMEVSCNDKRKPFLEKIVTETGSWPSWMSDNQIQYVQENGFNMESNQSSIESLKEYAEQLKADGLISGYDINNDELRLSSVSGKYNELEERVKTSISSIGAHSYYKKANRGRMPVPGYPKLCIRLKSEITEESMVGVVEEYLERNRDNLMDIQADYDEIVNTFTDEEKRMWGVSSTDVAKKEKKAIVFSKFLYDSSTPIAFAQCTDSGKLGLAKGDVNLSFAVHAKYRKKGLAVKVIKEAIKWFKGSKYETMSWIMDESNYASKHLAVKCGFVLMEHWKKKHQFFFMITNPSKLQAIGEGGTFVVVEAPTTIPKELIGKVHRDKFGNLKMSGNAFYVGMMENCDGPKWRHRIEYKMYTIRKTPQPCIMLHGEPYRARTDVMIINPKGELLVDLQKGRAFPYSFPGGGIDQGNSIESCAIREAAEEARVKVKDLRFTGIIWIAEYTDKTYNTGQISFLCIAKYYGQDHHKIAQEDKDEFVDRAKWVHWSKIGLGEPHMRAIELFLKSGSVHNVGEANISMTRQVATKKLHRKQIVRHATNGKNGRKIISNENAQFTDWF